MSGLKELKRVGKGGIDERNNFSEKNSYRFFFGY